MDKMAEATIKRMKKALFRVRQSVNGEFTKRFNKMILTINTPGYTGDGSELFDNKDMNTWFEEAMREAAGPVYGATSDESDNSV